MKTLALEAGHRFSWVRVRVEKNYSRVTRGELWLDDIAGGEQNHVHVSIDVLETVQLEKRSVYVAGEMVHTVCYV